MIMEYTTRMESFPKNVEGNVFIGIAGWTLGTAVGGDFRRAIGAVEGTLWDLGGGRRARAWRRCDHREKLNRLEPSSPWRVGCYGHRGGARRRAKPLP